MVDSILAVIVLILAGWAIAKNYDAKVVLFIAALGSSLLGTSFRTQRSRSKSKYRLILGGPLQGY